MEEETIAKYGKGKVKVDKVQAAAGCSMPPPERMSFSPTTCVNCDEPFTTSQDHVTSLQVGFCGEDEDETDVENALLGDEQASISIVKALYSVFSADTTAIENVDLQEVGLCLKCAQVGSQLYRYYVDLLNLSTSTSPISLSIEQFKKWHLENPSTQLLSASTNGESVPESVPTISIITTSASNGPREEPLDESKDLNSNGPHSPASNHLNSASELTLSSSKDENTSTMTDSHSVSSGSGDKGKSKESLSVSIRKSTRERKKKHLFDPDDVEMDPSKTKSSGVPGKVGRVTKKNKVESGAIVTSKETMPKKTNNSKSLLRNSQSVPTEKVTSKSKLKVKLSHILTQEKPGSNEAAVPSVRTCKHFQKGGRGRTQLNVEDLKHITAKKRRR